MKREENEHVDVSTLVCGEFHVVLDYDTWRPAGTDDWLLIYTLGGEGLISDGSHSWTVGEHDVLLYEPGAPQDYRTAPSLERWDLLWCHFQPRTHWLPWLVWSELSPGVRRLHLGEAVSQGVLMGRFREAIRVRVGPHPMSEALAMNAFGEVLIHCAAAAAEDAKPPMDARVTAAMEFLSQTVDQPFCLALVAKHVGLSPSRLSHVFKSQAGTSLQTFAEERRLLHGAELLRYTSRSIKDIAYSTGFRNPYYFSLRFKAWSGRCPSLYREALA